MSHGVERVSIVHPVVVVGHGHDVVPVWVHGGHVVGGGGRVVEISW